MLQFTLRRLLKAIACFSAGFAIVAAAPPPNYGGCGTIEESAKQINWFVAAAFFFGGGAGVFVNEPFRAAGFVAIVTWVFLR